MKWPHKCPACSRAALVMFTSIECCNIHCKHYSVDTRQEPPDAGWEEEQPTRPGYGNTTIGAPVCCGKPMDAFSATGTTLDWHCWTCGRVA